jgi:hypothetical protein
MPTETTRVELAYGTGIDFGPGADWQAFTEEMSHREGNGSIGRIKSADQLGLVAGQLVLRELGTEDLTQVRGIALRFAMAANPPMINGISRNNFCDGIESAIQIELAKEAIAA